MDGWLSLARGDVRLEARDFGGDGPLALLLHGLAGHAEEWSATAAWLTAAGHRVVALDQRGHGRSERRPAAVTRAAYVADAAMAIEALSAEEPAVVIGQSLGAHTAFLLAAERPELVRALVVVEATAAGPATDLPSIVEAGLGAWPIPFATREDALSFFGGADTLTAQAWADGLRPGEGGLHPAFDRDVMVAAVAELAERAWWDEWAAVRCPTLLVRGERGSLSGDDAARMAAARPGVEVVALDGGHDVHLDAPQAWQAATTAFLAAIAAAGADAR